MLWPGCSPLQCALMATLELESTVGSLSSQRGDNQKLKNKQTSSLPSARR